MSEMLEQAIIDADALKQAAVKNAETLVLEKFSNQIRDAVDILLEQDEPLVTMPEGEEPFEALEDMPEAVAEEADTGALESPEAQSSILEHIPLAVTSDDTEQIEIPLDKLMEELSAINESLRFEGDTHNDPDLVENNLLELNEEELEEDEEKEMPMEEELPMEEPMLEEEEEVSMSVKQALKTLEKSGMSVYAGTKTTPATRRVAREKPVAINWAEFSKSIDEVDRMAERAGVN